ncbi:MAG: hypothetical protein V7701_09675 [Sneathiella sp.]
MISKPPARGDIFNNVKEIAFGYAESNNVSPIMDSGLNLLKLAIPGSNIAYFLTPKKMLEKAIIKCWWPDELRPNGIAHCQAYLDRRGYTIQIRFLAKVLPEWKSIFDKVDEYVEKLRRRGDQAAGMLD